MAQINLWTDDEMIIVLDLYFKLPFGRLNRNTPEVKALAKLIGRTDNSVALRLVNYAACDPYILSTGRHGMASGRDRCMPYWDQYANDKERLFSIRLSYELKQNIGKDFYDKHIGFIADRKLRLPIEHIPDTSFLEFHYNNIFIPHN